MSNMLVYSLIGLAVIFIVFLILRELFCWYWKVNKICDLLELQNTYLLELCKKQGVVIEADINSIVQDYRENKEASNINRITSDDFSKASIENGKMECPNCNNEISINDKKCPYCNTINEAYGTQL